MNAHRTPTVEQTKILSPARQPILTSAEVEARMLLLAELQTALGQKEIRCVLARKHLLVLRYNETPLSPSGLTDPSLHIFGSAGSFVASTDGVTYRLDNGEQFPASDPVAAAACIARSRRSPAPPA
jgi:hypothetical protein